MSKRISSLVLLVILFSHLFFQSPIIADVKGASLRSNITFEAVADASINSLHPDTCYGDSGSILITYADFYETIGLIKFDLSSLPSDAVVINATMQLYLSATTLEDEAFLGVYRITSSWDESSITWNTAQDLTVTPSGIVAVIDNVISEWKNFDLLGDYVQTWIDDPATNHGLMIRALPSSETCIRGFYSREFEYDPRVPYLEVTYYQKSYYQQLSGRVYQGDVGNELRAIEDVKLDLYCSMSPDDLGTWVDTTSTDSTGWYGLKGYFGCDYYNIVETDPSGFISAGATSVQGTVITSNQIQYQAPLVGQTLTGNKFWDKPEFNFFLPLITK